MSPSIAPSPARAWAEIDLGALVANARAVAVASGVPLLPMVKANGYGLGAVAVARALEAVDPWGFGVATVAEAVELRSAGITRPIVAFSPLVPAAVAETRAVTGLRPALGDLAAVEAWLATPPAPFHVEIDTGMGRAGFRWDDQAALTRLADRLATATEWEGVFTQFHSAESDPVATARQWQRFEAVVAALPRRPALVHAANSAAALGDRRYAADLVRPGIFLYGGMVPAATPRAVVRLLAPVVARRRVAAGDSVSYGASWSAPESTTIATLAAGYADGVVRALGGRGRIELAGRAVPIVGRVTMDLTMVAVPDDAVAVGDVACVYGGLISLDDQARAADTIAYDLLTGLGSRIPRRHRSAE